MWSSYPLNIEAVCSERVARWRPLLNWVACIPLYIWAKILTYGAYVVSVFGWSAILFTGRMPGSFSDYLVAVLRYRWRLNAYLSVWSTATPAFGLSPARSTRATIQPSFTVRCPVGAGA
jgi:hypothetical protein